MKIERDKFYRTRKDCKRKIISMDGRYTGYTIISENARGELRLHDTEGFTSSPQHSMPDDLIAEWIDKPEIDWSKMAAWHRYTAMDVNGKWHVFQRIPNISGNEREWTDGCFLRMSIPNEYAPNWTGDWRESLVERQRQACSLA